MSLVRSFEGYRPPKRFDGLPFTEVDVEESADRTTGFLVIETIPLDPADPDPANPVDRNFTTALATLDPAWYRPVWRDAGGNTFTSDPVFFDEGSDSVTGEARARERLKRLVEASEDPILSDTEIEDLLVLARRADPAGLPPSDVDWVPTWNLNAAAADGWRLKAGKAAKLFDAGVDANSFRRSQIYAQCIQQAAEYARKSAQSVRVRRPRHHRRWI